MIKIVIDSYNTDDNTNDAHWMGWSGCVAWNIKTPYDYCTNVKHPDPIKNFKIWRKKNIDVNRNHSI